MSLIAENLKNVNEAISFAELKYHRKPHSVILIAVTKKQSATSILQAWEAGQKKFAENFVQEALKKMETLKNKSIEWHFIGTIQANKTKKIAENFDWVHSVSRIKIAERLNDQRPKELSPLNVCIEVNIEQEPTKSGVFPEEVIVLAKKIKACHHLHLRGLMAIPPIIQDKKKQIEIFSKVKALQENLNQQGFLIDTLSMGMSGDFEEAIAAGSTMVRIGEAIFGKRE